MVPIRVLLRRVPSGDKVLVMVGRKCGGEVQLVLYFNIKERDVPVRPCYTHHCVNITREFSMCKIGVWVWLMKFLILLLNKMYRQVLAKKQSSRNFTLIL